MSSITNREAQSGIENAAIIAAGVVLLILIISCIAMVILCKRKRMDKELKEANERGNS